MTWTWHCDISVFSFQLFDLQEMFDLREMFDLQEMFDLLEKVDLQEMFDLLEMLSHLKTFVTPSSPHFLPLLRPQIVEFSIQIFFSTTAERLLVVVIIVFIGKRLILFQSSNSTYS